MDKLLELTKEVSFRDSQFNLLYDLLMKKSTFLYPLFHLYGLSGTGKTYSVKRFMDKFCNNKNAMKKSKSKERERYYIYLNCNEVCYATMSLLFNEILIQMKKLFSNSVVEEGFEMETEMVTFEDDDTNEVKMADCSSFVRQLKKFLAKIKSQTCFYFIFDHADNLKYFTEASNLILTLSKLNEYLVNEFDDSDNIENVSICSIFISEIDWHSLISDCDLMSKTESPRPFIIHFNDYNKEEMYAILKQTACSLVAAQENFQNRFNEAEPNSDPNRFMNIQFYTRIILDVFYPICKDLNEIQYLIQIYYDQLMNSMEIDNNLTYEKMLSVWNKMRPFLKQALTQIYLRQSMFDSSSKISNKISSSQNGDEILSKEFENLNLINEKTVAGASLDLNMSSAATNCNQFPKLIKFLLISSYIATHNPVKYDKKLFDINSVNKSRKSKFTNQKLQQNEENQRAAALKTQTFDLNRLLAIFFPILSEYGYTHAINLSQIQINLKTLKSLHYLQQMNSSYACLDEPKYKCLLDLETIQSISASLNFNIKQYLAEFLLI